MAISNVGNGGPGNATGFSTDGMSLGEKLRAWGEGGITSDDRRRKQIEKNAAHASKEMARMDGIKDVEQVNAVAEMNEDFGIPGSNKFGTGRNIPTEIAALSTESLAIHAGIPKKV